MQRQWVGRPDEDPGQGARRPISCRRRRLRLTLVVGLVVALGGTAACQPTTRVPTEPVPPTIAPNTTPVAVSWTPVAGVEGLEAQRPGDLRLVSSPDGPLGPLTLVVEGGPADAPAADRVLLLQHEPGAWHVAPTAGLPAPPDALADLPDRYLAIVNGYDPATQESLPDMVYSSRDGRAWTALGRLPDITGVRTATAGGVVLVCGGAMGDGPPCARSETRGDRLTWHPVDVLPGGWDLAALVGVGRTFLAVARDTANRVRTLISADGSTWTVQPADATLAIAGGRLEVLPLGGGIVAAASVAGDRRAYPTTEGALFWSGDGQSWRRIAVPPTGSSAFALLRVGRAIMASGERRQGTAWESRGLLASADGLSWRLDPGTAPFGSLDGFAWAPGDSAALLFGARGEQIEFWEARVGPAADAGIPAEPLATAPAPAEHAPGPLDLEIVASLPGEAHAIAADAERIVIVGSRDALDGRWLPVSWASSDGQTWIQGSPLGDDRSRVASVVVWGGTFVAAGASEREGTSVKHAAFWTSRDGLDWKPTGAFPDDVLGEEGIPDGPALGIRVLISGSGGLTAPTLASHPDRGVVFHSADGMSWQRSGGFGAALALAGTAHGGSLVVVGHNIASDVEPGRAVIWTSADGSTWASRSLDSPSLNAVASTGRQVVAVGDGPVAWRSSDAVQWDWAPDQAALGWGSMTAAAGLSSGVIGVGLDRVDGAERLSLWRSLDGVAWSQAPLPGSEASGTQWSSPVIAAVAGRVIVAATGTRAKAAGSTVTIWVGTVQ